jgi:hypothetical protein
MSVIRHEDARFAGLSLTPRGVCVVHPTVLADDSRSGRPSFLQNILPFSALALKKNVYSLHNGAWRAIAAPALDSARMGAHPNHSRAAQD